MGKLRFFADDLTLCILIIDGDFFKAALDDEFGAFVIISVKSH